MRAKPNSWLQQQAYIHPERPAFYWQNESWSFAVLNQKTQQFAHYYRQQLPEDCAIVAIHSANSAEMYVTILALWELGITVQCLNTHLTDDELLYQLQDTECSFVICASTLDLPHVTTVRFPTLAQIPANYSIVDRGYELDTVASIMYTSGTTGKPKGVPQTFRNHLASATATKSNLAITTNDCWLCALPLFHISGLSILLRSLTLTMSVYLLPQFDAQMVYQLLMNGTVSVWSSVTKTLRELLPLMKQPLPASFRYCLLGGGPCDLATLEQCAAKKTPVIQSYGMTETCSQIVALPPQLATKKLGSAGQPLGDTQIKIVGKNDEGVGEIWAKSSSIVTYYLNGRSPESWENGWFKTGDIGYLDADNCLYIKSRQSELIISGGENIYPAEIEATLLRYPAIKEAAVIGIPDEKWGARPVAYLVSDTMLDLEDIRNYLMTKLAKYKQPDSYYQTAAIPKTASGKPLKRLLTEQERRINIVNAYRATSRTSAQD